MKPVVAEYDTVMRDAFTRATISPSTDEGLIKSAMSNLRAGRGRIRRRRMWAIIRNKED